MDQDLAFIPHTYFLLIFYYLSCIHTPTTEEEGREEEAHQEASGGQEEAQGDQEEAQGEAGRDRRHRSDRLRAADPAPGALAALAQCMRMLAVRFAWR